MNIRILAVGSIKESFYKEAVAEFKKRLTRYASLEIIEVKDEKTVEKASEAIDRKIKASEGKRLLSKLNESDFVVVLAIEGQKLSSTKFSQKLAEWEVSAGSRLTFIIGGSIGLCDELIKRANVLLSFSDMTFPHQLMRVILCEQLYRSYRIRNNEPYHK